VCLDLSGTNLEDGSVSRCVNQLTPLLHLSFLTPHTHQYILIPNLPTNDTLKAPSDSLKKYHIRPHRFQQHRYTYGKTLTPAGRNICLDLTAVRNPIEGMQGERMTGIEIGIGKTVVHEVLM
jgi:hypothetical protein